MTKLLLSSALLLALTPMLLAGRGHGRPAPRPLARRAPAYRPAAYRRPAHRPPASQPSAHRPPAPRRSAYRPPIHKPPIHGTKGHTKTVSVKSYAKLYGKKFSGGYYYKGAHHHWKKTIYNRKWKTTLYFDPSTRKWYYWYATGKTYYPIGYMSVAVPTTAGAPAGEEDEETIQTDDRTPEESIPEPKVPEPEVGE
jgi:hypothetical protein